MAETPAVSIIMPAYKQAEYIAEAIESVKRQTCQSWELIIVDDGSPDNVAEVVAPFCEADKRIKFYHTENTGVSAARNFAASKTKGEYLLPLDADDTIEPTYIEKCLNRFAEHPETDVVYCKWHFFGDARKTPKLRYKGYDELLQTNGIFVSAVIRKASFDAIGGYDENMYRGMEDWEFWIRFLNHKSIVYQIPEELFNYRIKKNSRNVEAKKQEQFFDIEMYVMGKHRDKYLTLFGRPIQAINEALKYKRKYYNIWYKKLWYSCARLLGNDILKRRFNGNKLSDSDPV